MKKIKLLLPMMILMLGLAGCGDDNEEAAFIDVQDYSEQEMLLQTEHVAVLIRSLWAAVLQEKM